LGAPRKILSIVLFTIPPVFRRFQAAEGAVDVPGVFRAIKGTAPPIRNLLAEAIQGLVTSL
jgi:hypothetical protein